MANKKETKNKNVHEIVIKIDGDAWKEALDKAFNEKKKDDKTIDKDAIPFIILSW